MYVSCSNLSTGTGCFDLPSRTLHLWAAIMLLHSATYMCDPSRPQQDVPVSSALKKCTAQLACGTTTIGSQQTCHGSQAGQLQTY